MQTAICFLRLDWDRERDQYRTHFIYNGRENISPWYPTRKRALRWAAEYFSDD